MRYSIDAEDPGYGAHVGDVAAVIFNGVIVTDALTADEVTGEVVVYCYDHNGDRRYDAWGDPITETLEGTVQVVRRSRLH